MKILKTFVIVLAIVSAAFFIGCQSKAPAKKAEPAKKAPAAVEQTTPAPAPAVKEGATEEEKAEPAAEAATETKATEKTEEKTEEPKTDNPK